MRKIKILATGANEGIMQTILRLINNTPSWVGDIALSAEDARSKLQSKNFDLVLLGAGSDEENIRLILKDCGINIPVVLHYGGGSGLLSCEIRQALRPSSI